MKFIDTKSKKVYNEGDLYTFVEECKKCGVYCKSITKFSVNKDTIKITMGRLIPLKEEQKPNERKAKMNNIREKTNELVYSFFDAFKNNTLFNRMVVVAPKSAVTYVMKEMALSIEHIMNYKGHIKNEENPCLIVMHFDRDTAQIRWELKEWKEVKGENEKLPYKLFAFFRDAEIAINVADEVCSRFNKLLANKNGK